MKSPITVIIFFLFFILLTPARSLADGAFDNSRDELYSKIEMAKKPAFVAQCGNRDDKSAILLFDVAGNTMTLYQEHDGDAVAVESIELNDKGYIMTDPGGGEYTFARTNKLIEELIRSGFDLLSPFTVKKLKALKIRKNKCKYWELLEGE